MNILLVEDDAMMAAAVIAGLRQNGWSVDLATDAPAARLALVDHGYTAVLLDLGLPGGSGLAVLQGARDHYDTVPVIIITARDALSSRVAGLDAGADDYVIKPFSIEELSARLRALVRRAQGRVGRLLSHGHITLDPARRIATCGGDTINLSLHECRTLAALLEHPERTVTREQLQDAVYGGAGTIESNTIAVFIHQLRRKLGEAAIETVHGIGYRAGATSAPNLPIAPAHG